MACWERPESQEMIWPQCEENWKSRKDAFILWLQRGNGLLREAWKSRNDVAAVRQWPAERGLKVKKWCFHPPAIWLSLLSNLMRELKRGISYFSGWRISHNTQSLSRRITFNERWNHSIFRLIYFYYFLGGKNICLAIILNDKLRYEFIIPFAELVNRCCYINYFTSLSFHLLSR